MNEEYYHEDDLIRVYSPPSLGRVMAGNRVMLICGGPKMTVCEDGESNDDVLCAWEGEDGKIIFHHFTVACLTCWGAE